MASTSTSKPKKLSKIGMIFREQFFDKMKSLYEAEMFCDVTLIASDKRIPAHRIILSAASPYFSTMFTNDLQETIQQEKILHEILGNELKTIIDFCYTGFIDITEMNVFALLETASQIEFALIEKACAEFLQNKLNVSNCLTIWISSESFLSLKELTAFAMKFIEDNFVEVSKTQKFLLLDVNHLTTLLISDNLNVYSEEEVFNAVSMWINYDLDKRKSHIKDLLSTIRFTELKSKFLSEAVGTFCEQMNELDLMKDICQWKVMPKTQLLTSPRPSTLQKRLIAIGNNLRSSSEDRCSEIYCPIRNEWKIFEQFKCERIGFSSAVLGDNLFILGGYCPETSQDLRSVKKYSFSTWQRKEVEPMIIERSWHATTVLNNEIYVAGGRNSNSVEKFDPKVEKWSEITPMLQARRDLELVMLSGRLFAVGGYGNDNYLDSVECFDPLKNKWHFVASMNRKRCSHSVAAHKNHLYAIGGLDTGLVNDSVEYYDPIIDKWSLIETLTIPRYGFSVANYRDLVIVAGGAEKGNKLKQSVIKIDFGELTKEHDSIMNYGRWYFSLIELPCYNPNT